MGKEWEATIELTERQATQLIEQQFPHLAPVQMVVLGSGWDNTACLVDQHLVFRFPRREIAAGLLEREARILPLLAPHLPLRVPVPEYVGSPTEAYPYVWAGYPILPGQTACRFFCSDEDRAALAPAIGRFLGALHRIPVDSTTLQWAPGDEINRADVPARAPRVKERILLNGAGLASRDLQTLIDLVDDLASTPLGTVAPCWVHGDFYARHLILGSPREPVGVIDWGDVHIGDPAVDISIAFSFLPPSARTMFRQAYGRIDDATWNRARFRAIHYGALLVEYGHGIEDASLEAVGEYALKWAPVDP